MMNMILKTKKTQRHICVDIDGAIERINDGIDYQLFKDISNAEALVMLKERKAKGKKVVAACDADTPEGYCPGHPVRIAILTHRCIYCPLYFNTFNYAATHISECHKRDMAVNNMAYPILLLPEQRIRHEFTSEPRGKKGWKLKQ